MGFVKSVFGNHGYADISSGESVTGAIQAVKPVGGGAVVTLTNKQGDDSTDLFINGSDILICTSSSVSCSSGRVLAYLAGANYSKS